MQASWFPLLITFIGALAFGWLTWVAKHVWRNKTKTQLFALLAIIFIVSFMILGLESF